MENVVLGPYRAGSSGGRAQGLHAGSRTPGRSPCGGRRHLADRVENPLGNGPRKPGFAGDLTRDQMLRLSALIGLYKSPSSISTEAISAGLVKAVQPGSLSSTVRGPWTR